MFLGPSRKSSRASVSSNGPQGVGPNGAYASVVGLSNPHFAAMASSQNLPAVLNDPRKGELSKLATVLPNPWFIVLHRFKAVRLLAILATNEIRP